MQKEETIHALLGAWIINKVKKEQPEWFNEDFYQTIEKACKKAFNAELKIIEWIFQNWELDFLSIQVITEFIKNRFNESLEMIGAKPIFDINKDLLKLTEWFNIENLSETHTDFFWKTPTTYLKKAQSITENDLFWWK